ncbi:c-type cytochrome [Acetobacter sp.]|uniref:c-type cytochrome n=1 Tax=Acetobacter sp. TaxID=440 RepID=UPI0025BABDDF|nr:cytochrome c [Acetobacter sp.]MCH4089870.1 cytochrome c [Acetobacter sp.]MCI1298566.1 cytochrome c [Acetobacter sp.]MCI1315131.1 cytochrome c [Acetobacter sp.]
MKKILFSLSAAAFLAGGVAVSGQAQAAADGQQLYTGNCSLCHQASAAGVVGQFPPLKGRIAAIASTPEGKAYVMHVLLNGLTGMIKAGGNPYMGYMPSFGAQSDENIAAILTYVASLGDAKPAPTFTADEVKKERASSLTPMAVLEERNKLNAAHPVP